MTASENGPFGSLNYERLYREQNDDALDLTRQAVFVSSGVSLIWFPCSG